MKGMVYIISAVFFWGIWGIFGKMATKHYHPLVVMLLSYAVIPVFLIPIYFILKFRAIPINFKFSTFHWTLLPTLTGALGGLAFYYALENAQASTVVSLTSIYPVVTVVLSVLFFKETFTTVQTIGLILILTGAYLIIGK